METEVKDGAATEQIADEKPAFGPEDVQRMIDEAVGETNKAWQSRFDKILTEKKQTESKALTVEEQIAQLKAEREAERIGWVRKEARAKAGIDDSFEAAALAYASNDPERILEAANTIKSFFESKEVEYKKQIDELNKKLQFGTKAPVGGGGSTSNQMKMADFLRLDGKAQADFMKSGGKLTED